MLPGAQHAVVEPAKIRDYLLSTSHPVGRFKAVVFFSLGYTTEDWVKLHDDILSLARNGEAGPARIASTARSTRSVVLSWGPTGEQEASRPSGSSR